jgi:NAD(P)-dependent dehydrogenase (short-subunit alcohol dehydrogenase family)
LKTALITGANSGIGKQAAIQLAQKGYRVFVGARSKLRGDDAVQEIKEKSNSMEVELLLIDLSSRKSIADATLQLNKQLTSLDVLIHNAAAFDITQKEPMNSLDGIETIWATNHLGPILLTNALMPLLKKNEQGRIVTIASQGLVMNPRLRVDLSDPEFKNRKFSVSKAYYQSKIAQVMYTYWLAEQLKESTVTVNCIRVTNVKIDTTRYPDISPFMKFLYSIKTRFSISPEEMAKTYVYLATSPDLRQTTGKYYNEKNKIVSSSAYSINQDSINAVMKLSLEYIDK